MNEPLDLIWAVLESPEPIIANSAWHRLSKADRALLDSVGLLKRHVLNEIQCPVCSDGHRSPVHEVDCPSGEIQYSIECPAELQIIIEQEQRVTRRIEPKRVAESISCSLELTGDVRSISGDRFYFCGYYEYRDVRVEIYFGRGLNQNDGAQITSSLPKSFLPQLVWVPQCSSKNILWDMENPPAVLLLAGMTGVDHIRLVVHREVFVSTVRELVLNRAHPEHMFVKRGATWEICYQGSVPVSVKASKGMSYIAQLLEFPRRSISSVELQTIEANIGPRAMRGSKGEIIDIHAKEEYEKLLPTLRASQEQARVVGDMKNVDSLNEQIQAIEDQLRCSTNIRGELRKQLDCESARTSVTNAINTAIKNITKEHQELGVHLRNSISTGHNPVYQSDSNILWVI